VVSKSHVLARTKAKNINGFRTSVRPKVLQSPMPEIFDLFPFFDEFFCYLVSSGRLSLPSFPEVAESSSPSWTFPTSARKFSWTSVLCTSALKVPEKYFFG
jgi:hypothetical protein